MSTSSNPDNSSSNQAPEQFNKGWKPDADKGKEAQGGDDSRPPGKQHVMPETPIDDVYADGTPYKAADKLKGKVCLTTGGDSGIGRAFVILAAMEGAENAIVYLPQEEEDAKDTQAYVKEKTGKEILLLPYDVKVEENCIKCVEETVAKFGRLDVLFNNAAQQLQNNDILTLDSQQWRDTFEVNMHSYFYTSKAAIPHLKKQKGSSIIMNSSINAGIGRPDLLDYTATKGSIISFARGLSNQIVGKTGIRVNCICPGPILTPLVTSTFSRENISQTDSTPIGRPGQPIEVATCVIFLASQDSSFVTGQLIHCNGGTPQCPNTTAFTQGRPDLLDYTSTKGSIVSFTRGLSNQIVGKAGVRVNPVAPGPILTPLVTSTFSRENISQTDGTSIGRPGQSIEVATCCIFLASQDASYVTGQVIHCNGGTPC
ncbi:hypothetical protein JCM3765_000830 [Sporobolomyces pararoseus]